MANSGVAQLIGGPFEDLLAPATDLDLDMVLRRTVRSAREQTGARRALLAVFGESGDVIHVVPDGLTQEQARRVVEERDGPEDGAAGARSLEVPITVEDTAFARLRVSEKEAGRSFTADDEAALAALAGVAGIAVRNARSYGISERRREWGEATAELMASLQPPVQLISPLTVIAACARRASRAFLTAVVCCGEDGYDVPVVDGPASEVLLPDLLDEYGPRMREAQVTHEPFVTGYGDSGTIAVVPLESELAFEGVLMVVLRTGSGALRVEDRELLTSFVMQGSFALDRAVVLMERQQSVVEADRHRIARDLHDLVIQRLFATGMRLRGSLRAANPVPTQETIEASVEHLEEAIRDIRATVFELEHGTETSLRAGVAALAREYVDALGFTPTVHTWGPLNALVGGALAGHALAVLREALANCSRHAAATRCVVDVTVAQGWITLQVTDDGRGLPERFHESGLRNLRARADELGGSLELTRVEPHGVLLEWRAPVTDQ